MCFRHPTKRGAQHYTHLTDTDDDVIIIRALCANDQKWFYEIFRRMKIVSQEDND